MLRSRALVGLSGLVFMASIAGCHPAPPPRTGRLVHVVFIKFPEDLDATKRREFVEDVRDALVRLPTVQTFHLGQPAPTKTPDRPMVDDNYDLGLAISFASRRGLQEFLDHPDHAGFMKKWEGRFEARVFDFEPQ
jgi:hypothetical protein